MSKNSFKVSAFTPKDFKVISCAASDSLAKAKSLMVLNDFSQLPVLDEKNKILGAISWKSIGKSEFLDNESNLVKDYMEDAAVIKNTEDFLKYLKLIARKEFVLVKNYHGELVGIITTYDMTINFKEFLIPFLKIGIVEDSLRKIITDWQLEVKGGKKPENLVFSEYIKVFQDEKNWQKMKFRNLDKASFIDKLNEIRVIRNKIAHYKPDGISSQEIFNITSFAEIIEKFSDSYNSNEL
ncbi:CBS domain-containing protein [Pedobacter helvus]|uniref:HPP family protein n=1 Tax=Pedobacter helvus TaxID=2563444 RepID=A0ABW9JFN3_9SPHI|nr:CBS domain-containing protein [Pedobacter ureilyticus]